MATGMFSPDYPIAGVGGELLLPRPPGVIRRFWARHPWLTDSLVTAIYFVPTFVATLFRGFAPEQGPTPFEFILQLCGVLVAAAAILFRRYRPWLTMSVVWGVALVISPLGNVDMLPILFGLYALAVYRSSRAAWIGFGGSVAVAASSAYVTVWLSSAVLPSYVSVWNDTGSRVAPFGTTAPVASSQFAIVMLVATLIGITIGNRRRYLLALIERAHDLARQRDQQAQLATAHERSRIAREMHDIVSHSLTVMITLADGSAATTPRDPAQASAAMRIVAETGRTALSDMRRMLGVLADTGEAATELLPQPGWDELPELLERFRAAGMPVTLRTSGATVTNPTAQLTIYRTVQEGLTNVLKHSPHSQIVAVEIHNAPPLVEITVRDDATPSTELSTSAMPTEPAGHGLVGMRERLALYNGTLQFGPITPRGWLLRARFEVPA